MRELHQLDDASQDDRDDGRTDTVKDTTHPAVPPSAHVKRRQHEDHQERRQHEREPDERRTEHAAAHPTQVDSELSRERARGQLGESQPLHVVLPRDPAPTLDQVALHVPRQRDGTAETKGP